MKSALHAKHRPACAHTGAGRGQCRPKLVLKAQASANQSTPTVSAVFPASYEQVVRQVQESVKSALSDGHLLLEVDFPSLGLTSVQGDSEGMNEMNASMGYLRDVLRAFRDDAASIRVFWPDNQELAVAMSGQSMDPAAGRKELKPVFEDSGFKHGFLTQQNAVWAALGVNVGFGKKFSPVQQVKDSDKMLVAAYPYFNPREEMTAVYELYNEVTRPRGIPLMIFNGELDKLRGGYYPSLFFGELAKLSNEFLPQFTQAYYLRNFKGRQPGALFRAYPGPWCVFRRNPLTDEMRLIWTSDTMPSLKQVATEILPSNL